MGKVNLLVKYCLINGNFEYNIKGIFSNNQIKYFDGTSKVVLNLETKILEKDNTEAKVTFNFSENECLYLDKETNKELKIPIEVLQLESNFKRFMVKYKNLDNIFEIVVKII